MRLLGRTWRKIIPNTAGAEANECFLFSVNNLRGKEKKRDTVNLLDKPSIHQVYGLNACKNQLLQAT